MVVLIVGHGGREAAIAWRLARSGRVSRLVVTGPNPGWPARAELQQGDPVVVARALRPDLAVIGPEGPLADGIADALAEDGIPCFGPTRAAAALETSKAFAKEVMASAGVRTADAIVVDLSDPRDRRRAEQRADAGEVVVKADGLAAGKGVIVCRTPVEAHAALDAIGAFGDAAARVVLEDRLEGPEVSVFAVCDGARAVPLISAQDHKQLRDGGEGPNTGGMGAIAPCPLLDAEATAEIVRTVHAPVIAEMARRERPFRGVLYAGLMLTEAGPRVLEFNVRFGDPECQVLMPLWEDDPVPWLLGAAQGELPAGAPRFSGGAATVVVLASRGYPQAAERGVVLGRDRAGEGEEEEEGEGDVIVFHAATRRDEDGTLRTNGGRVIGIAGLGADLEASRRAAYAALEDWRFDGAQYRTDIGAGGAGAVRAPSPDRTWDRPAPGVVVAQPARGVSLCGGRVLARGCSRSMGWERGLFGSLWIWGRAAGSSRCCSRGAAFRRSASTRGPSGPRCGAIRCATAPRPPPRRCSSATSARACPQEPTSSWRTRRTSPRTPGPPPPDPLKRAARTESTASVGAFARIALGALSAAGVRVLRRRSVAGGGRGGRPWGVPDRSVGARRCAPQPPRPVRSSRSGRRPRAAVGGRSGRRGLGRGGPARLTPTAAVHRERDPCDTCASKSESWCGDPRTTSARANTWSPSCAMSSTAAAPARWGWSSGPSGRS